MAYKHAAGLKGILNSGAPEWMTTGGGALHQRCSLGRGLATCLQLWVVMPPGLEDGEAFGRYVPPEDVPRLTIPGSKVRVPLG
jgi:redox-sensitive bicupin YhaK (pirin superfamily)